jgi:DNA-binding HxlR family transcriptional regulator
LDTIGNYPDETTEFWVYAEVPPRVEYRMSEIGESLRPVIDTLKAWGEGHPEKLSCAPALDAVKGSHRAA